MDAPLPPGYEEEVRGTIENIRRKLREYGIYLAFIDGVPSYVIVHIDRNSIINFTRETLKKSKNVPSIILRDNRVLVYLAYTEVLKDTEIYKLGESLGIKPGAFAYVSRDGELKIPVREDEINSIQNNLKKEFRESQGTWEKISKYFLLYIIEKSSEWLYERKWKDNYSFILVIVYHEGGVLKGRIETTNEKVVPTLVDILDSL